jgi:outer membrane receptor protein involved in Fe transport
MFGGENSITADQMTGLTYTGVSRGVNQLTAFQFNTSGELFKLWADRPVGLAAGYEYRIVAGENIPDPITVQGNTTGNKGDITKGHYYVNEGYGELSLPLVSGIDFVRELEGTAAIRAFNYSNFGGDYTYKFGGRWSIIPDFTFRGTYSTGFRAPGISDLYLGQSDSFPNVRDPCRGPGVQGGGPLSQQCLNAGIPATGSGDTSSQLRSRIGGNPSLQPETAKIYTAGIVVEPTFVQNLTVTADYYNIKVSNSITTVGVSTILNGCYSDNFAVSQLCTLVMRDPTTHRITNVLNLNTNIGSDATDGVDVSVNYVLPTEYGRFRFAFDGTYLHTFNRTLSTGQVIKGKGTFDIATTGGTYPSVKFISGITYGIGGLNAGFTMRYLGRFKECGDSSGQYGGGGLCYINNTYRRQVTHYDAYDIYASYNFNSMFGKTTLSAGINNLFDKAPAVIYNGFTAATDPEAYDLLGRFFFGRITQTF